MATANEAAALPKTDYTRWHYLETDGELAAWPQTTYDKYHLGMNTVRRAVHLVPLQNAFLTAVGPPRSPCTSNKSRRSSQWIAVSLQAPASGWSMGL